MASSCLRLLPSSFQGDTVWMDDTAFNSSLTMLGYAVRSMGRGGFQGCSATLFACPCFDAVVDCRSNFATALAVGVQRMMTSGVLAVTLTLQLQSCPDLAACASSESVRARRLLAYRNPNRESRG